VFFRRDTYQIRVRSPLDTAASLPLFFYFQRHRLLPFLAVALEQLYDHANNLNNCEDDSGDPAECAKFMRKMMEKWEVEWLEDEGKKL